MILLRISPRLRVGFVDSKLVRVVRFVIIRWEQLRHTWYVGCFTVFTLLCRKLARQRIMTAVEFCSLRFLQSLIRTQGWVAVCLGRWS
jgi:hypothetical protein